MKKATVLGSNGFIGSHLAAELRRRGVRFLAPGRNDYLADLDLGTVFYCIGLTADFRTRPFDTVAAHVCKLRQILELCRFDMLVYLSSTRLYGNAETANEEQEFAFNPTNPSDLYNLSKAMGESIALHSGKNVRIARLANVYGLDKTSDNFLMTLVRDAATTGNLRLGLSPHSAKDYISVHDVVELLIAIATHSEKRIYNVASGRNVSNRELTDCLHDQTGCRVEYDEQAPTWSFPLINVERIRTEFGFEPRDVLRDLPLLCERFLSKEAQVA